MKRILFFSHVFPPAVDGGSRILAKMAGLAEKQGREVLVLTSDAFSTDDYIDPKAKRLSPAREKGVIRLKTFRSGGRLIRRFTPGPIFLSLPLLSLRKWRPDLIIAGVFPTSVPFYAWLIAKICRTKLALLPCFHPDDQEFYRPLLTNILKKADFIYALTNQEKAFYSKRFKISRKKIKVFKPPIDESLIIKKDRKARFPQEPVLLFLGNQSAHKRIEFLIDAFEKLAERLPRLKLVIAGKRTLYSPKIDQRIGRLPERIKKKVRIINGYDRKAEKRLLDQAWVLVNPSIHESLGLVFLEAWARKKPVIGARIPALEEVIRDGKEGLLFEKDDRESLIEKITRLISNRRLAVKMGESGWQKMLKFNRESRCLF